MINWKKKAAFYIIARVILIVNYYFHYGKHTVHPLSLILEYVAVGFLFVSYFNVILAIVIMYDHECSFMEIFQANKVNHEVSNITS